MTTGSFQALRRFQDTENIKKCDDGTEKLIQKYSNSGSIVELSS
jgi:hypothetical protein